MQSSPDSDPIDLIKRLTSELSGYKVTHPEHEDSLLEEALLFLRSTDKTDTEKAYKEVYGEFPVTNTSANDWDITSWKAFQSGWEYRHNSICSEIDEELQKCYQLAQILDVIHPTTPGAFGGTPSDRIIRQLVQLGILVEDPFTRGE